MCWFYFTKAQEARGVMTDGERIRNLSIFLSLSSPFELEEYQVMLPGTNPTQTILEKGKYPEYEPAWVMNDVYF